MDLYAMQKSSPEFDTFSTLLSTYDALQQRHGLEQRCIGTKLSRNPPVPLAGVSNTSVAKYRETSRA